MSKAAAATPSADPSIAAPPAADPAAAAPPTEPAAAPPAVPDAKPADPPAEKTYTKADLERELAKAKKDQDKAIADAAAKAKLTEDERKDAELGELRTQLRMRDAKDDVVSALEKAGAKATGLMWNAIKGELEFDAKGKLTNLDGLVKDLPADYPDQFGIQKPAESIDAGGNKVPGEKLTKEKLAEMTPQEIAKIPWDEVKAVLSQA